MSIQKHTQLDFKKINYQTPEKQGLIYYSPINYNNEPFYLQTPKMICKKNLKDLIEKKNTNLEMETMNMDFSFYDFLANFDERNIKETFKNGKEWFNKDIPLEVIDNMYKRSCKPVKKNMKPIFSFKIPMIKEKIQCQLYDQKKICIDYDKLSEGIEIVCILHIKGLKFLKQHYYCDCYISQIKVFLDGINKYSILDSYSFDDKEEEENELKELEKDLMLDEDFLQNIQKEKEKKNKIKLELSEAEQNLINQQLLIDSLKSQMNDYE
tara:strand:+ start:816 stop:1616 length:801 start_codon:yes stop_codon:yes gene_type:complete